MDTSKRFKFNEENITSINIDEYKQKYYDICDGAINLIRKVCEEEREIIENFLEIIYVEPIKNIQHNEEPIKDEDIAASTKKSSIRCGNNNYYYITINQNCFDKADLSDKNVQNDWIFILAHEFAHIVLHHPDQEFHGDDLIVWNGLADIQADFKAMIGWNIKPTKGSKVWECSELIKSLTNLDKLLKYYKGIGNDKKLDNDLQLECIFKLCQNYHWKFSL